MTGVQMDGSQGPRNVPSTPEMIPIASEMSGSGLESARTRRQLGGQLGLQRRIAPGQGRLVPARPIRGEPFGPSTPMALSRLLWCMVGRFGPPGTWIADILPESIGARNRLPKGGPQCCGLFSSSC
jgi:hypothetical protein